ncbi:MAG: TonB-dependent receptor [Candidatus Latescibacteria bacterium]|nr:TonB-dependent receptor [Candidatus Latescibacterota bacterium]
MLRRLRNTVAMPAVRLALLAIVLLPAFASAQGAPGSIKGVIRDVESGEYLDYANVLLKGTSRGTMSLGGGVFYFQGLRPGQYTVQVLYLGFAPEEVTVDVEPGMQAEIRFDMKVVIVETLEAYAVEGDRYMVDIKSGVTEQSFTGDRLADYAIDSVEEAVAKQAGVQMRDGELYVRGGRSGEVSMRIDDVPVDNVGGGGAISVSSMAVEATELVTGGMDPEYGSAMSGVINVTTRAGGESFEGGLRYMTDDFGRQDKTYTNYDRFEFGFGGPTPVKKLTYFLAGDFVFTDTENYSVANRPEYRVDLGGATLFQFRRRQVNQLKGSTKWQYTFSENLRVTGEYTLNSASNESYSPNWSVSGYSRRVLMMPLLVNTPGDDSWLYTRNYVPVYYGPWYERMNQISRPAVVIDARNASLIRRMAPVLQVRSTDGRLYTVAAEPGFDGFRYPYSSYSTAQEDSSYTWFNSADRSGVNRSLSQNLKFVMTHNLTNDTFYTMKISALRNDNVFSVNGQDPWEYQHGPIASPGLFYGAANLYQNGSDYYTDPLNPLFVTTSDFPYYGEDYTETLIAKFDLSTTRWSSHLVKMGLQLQYNDIESNNLSYPAYERRNRFTGEYSLGASSNIFHSYNPEASWYIQDRWEYEGMVMNYGFRWDLFSPGSAAEILLDNDDVNKNVIKYKHQFSPRLGFAFPITERDGFNFSYGRFIQFPTRDLLFSSQDPLGNAGVLGNPNLKAETTIAYQAGIKHQFTDYLAGSVAIYSRDIYDLIAATTVTDSETGNTLPRYINKAYASARGVEVTLNKRYSDNFAFDVAYTFSYADGVASSQQFGANPEGLEYLPNQELPLNWDQRHVFHLSLLLQQPSSWSGSMTFSYGSGFPWTPNDRYARKVDPLLENSERLPATYDLTFQGQKEINFYGQRLTMYFQAHNLINQDMVRNPGAGLTPGLRNATSAYVSYLTETGKYGGAYLQDANGDNYNEFIPINDPRVFMDHRLFRVGLGWTF